ncbi:hypothetical protein GE09DRAFT_975301 [Coniochaeta sp. 2T2.1]|nr:hypothetical protein GE09DRAFT_975301 [Coniochaeta sp. 2T2.1]
MLWQCQLCEKPFTKESSYKRHISYCRRSQGRSRVRPTSCLACNAAKVKCTFQSPCRRCGDKGLACIYEVTKRNVAVHVQEANSVGDRQVNVSADAPVTMEEILASSDMQTVLDPGTFFGSFDISGNSSDVLQTYTTPQATRQLHRMSPPSWIWSPTSIQPRMGTLEQAPWSTWLSAVNISTPLLTPELNQALAWTEGQEMVATLQLIRSPSPVVQHSTRLIIQGLRAYPMMMLRRETLPPFIHPYWHIRHMPALPESLSTCMSIAHMYAFRSEETKPFLWRTIQAEDERFLAQRRTMSAEDMLACIQAQMIYMIMRFVDGTQDPPELNQQLIRTYQILCKLFRRLHNGPFCEPDNYILRPTWEEWIYAESRRRTACVFFLICRCISVSTGIQGCDAFHEFINLPLASPKQLWEARTREEWEREYVACAASYDSGIHTMGTLIEAHNRTLEDVGRLGALDSWNSRADGLGALLNIVTGMV